MLLKVPFYIQGINECGPAALQMVLEFFGEEHNREKIKKLVESESTGATWTTGLAKTAAQLGFKIAEAGFPGAGKDKAGAFRAVKAD